MTRSKNRRIPPIDYPAGTRFGLVVIVGRGESHGTGRVFRVRCDCGEERTVLGSSLRQTPPRTHRLCNAARAARRLARVDHEAMAAGGSR